MYMQEEAIFLTIEVSKLANIELNELTEAWNRCWHGYYYDMSFTTTQMKFWLDLGQVNLEHSVGLLDKGKIIGFSLLSCYEYDGWIAGTSIDPSKRGGHLFTPLMQAQLNLARNLGLQRIYLEVLKQNHARRVYQTVGFRELRQLNLYRIKKKEQHAPLFWKKMKKELLPGLFRVVRLDDYFAIRKVSGFNPAWQRKENYLMRYPNIQAFLNRQGSAGILFAGESGTLLDAWCSNAFEAGRVLAEITERCHDEITLINQPEDWLAAFLAQWKIQTEAIQYEMCAYL